ncbi:ROK family protein [Alloprevotella tannerae]|jgi:glucokinase|uniref:ROK family protein n=1 Tax=Alloprevotella tannerae TaxID=76122 RepID=UPI001EDC383B|nr:ROK family protein [Alloprevotella tannerae]MCG2646494.1 ROK family protein [Alloprevotella tannerae]MCG2649915.1 ROK family protein [Alloprevotella tannerae]MCG2652425.1 ROK family protein [Alloprevotella tannerae]
MAEENEIQPYVIGLDMGGTNSVFGVVDQRGTIKAQTVIKTKAYPDVHDYVNAAVEALQPAFDLIGGKENIKGMGIGAPNGNFYSGCIENAANLLWKDIVPITALFEDALDIPVRVTNDANAAAMGEMTYGVARGMKNFTMITLGTGVGSGIVVDGKLVYGCDGFAGELGHSTIVRGQEARQCGCGRKGCLETYCSATGVARTARLMLEKSNEPSMLRDIDPDKITSFDVFQAAEAGEQIAKDIFDFTGTVLGEACANFALFSAPEAFVFFGGLVKAGHWILDPIQAAYDANSLASYKGKAKLLVSSLNGSEAAVLGASALGWE